MQTKINYGGYAKKLRRFLLTDVKIINKYLLITIILVILSFVGLTSYALFSYEVEQENSIKIVYSDLKGPVCVIDGPDVSEIGINSNANYTMNCTDNFGVIDTTLTSDNFTVTGDITISNIEKEQIDNGYKYIITITSSETSTTGNIKLKANTIQDKSGNYNKESNVSSDINVVTFPPEPTEYVFMDTYTSSGTFIAPENGYFQIELFGSSGNGGKGHTYTSSSPFHYYFNGGNGGGGGAYANSRVKLNKGDKITFTIGGVGATSSVVIKSSKETYANMQTTSGTDAGDITSTAHMDTCGEGGVASGGNYQNINGEKGLIGQRNIVWSGTTRAVGGSGGSPGYTGGNVGGKGGDVYNKDGTSSANIEKYAGDSGKSGFIKIYRGNTN